MLNRSLFLTRRFGQSAVAKPAPQKEDIEGLEHYWERAMGWYTTFNAKLSLKTYRTVSPFLQLDKAKKVLEIGGGTGSGAEILLPLLNPAGTYTLTDHIETFLKVARSKNLPNTEVIKVIPSKLPFSGESFDRFVALATIEELETTKNIIREAYRVLQPGGIIAASLSGKREADNYRVIAEKVRQKFGIPSELKFRTDLQNSGFVRRMFQDVGFTRTFLFYEYIQFESENIQELKNFFMQEPSIAEQSGDKLKMIDQYLEKQLNEMLQTEETPLGTDFLVILGYKD